jgi:rifampicin phosphotransferase
MAAGDVIDTWMPDSTLSVRFPIYTRANVGEVFPDPVTPLTFDLGLWMSELGWRDALVRIGALDVDELPPDEFSMLGVVGGYCYLNASVVRLFGERAPGLSWRVIDTQLFGTQPGIPAYEEQDGDVRPDTGSVPPSTGPCRSSTFRSSPSSCRTWRWRCSWWRRVPRRAAR